MPDSAGQPVRVLVKGASTAVMTSWMGGPRTDLAYPRVIEASLLAAGCPAEVRVTAAVGARAKDSLKTWEREVVTWSPDVIILHYGQYEVIHLLIPRWFERYANSVKRRPGPVRDTFHALAVRKSYMALARVQTLADRRPPERLMEYRTRQMAAHLERLVKRARNISSPLVLMLDQLHPGPTWARPFPGMARRVDMQNAALDRLIAGFGSDEVRRFSISEVVAGLGTLDELTPDGGHFAPFVHRAVGQALAAEILEWLAATAPRAASPQTLCETR